MSDVWFHSADEREAMIEAERAGTTIERHGLGYHLRKLAGGDAEHFETLEALRDEVKARLQRIKAEEGEREREPEPEPIPPQPQQDEEDGEDEDDEGDDEDESEESDEDKEEQPAPHRRAPHRPTPRRRR